MRRLPALLLVVATALALLPAVPAGAGEVWQPRIARARTYAEDRAGSISFAVVNAEGRISGYRMKTSVPAASVLKVMFMVAYLRQKSVRGRDLRDSDADLLRPMIRRSDNTTASRIADMVGPKGMYRLANRANMRDFSYTRPWGLSRTSARDQARFLFRLKRYIPDRHEAYALRLLRRIVDSQRWGIGQVDTPGWTKHFKGGWGSGSGAVDHQVARLVDRPGTRVGLAVMTTSSPDHTYGKRTLRGVFGRLLSNLP
jgi:hypothetical protein